MPELTREQWLAKINGPAGERRLGRLTTKRIMYPDYVYFLRCGDYVKVGRSRDPRKRLAMLSASVPYPCELLLVISGPPSLERELHHLFREARERYEWFALSDVMRTYIANHKHRCLAPRFRVLVEEFRTNDGTPPVIDPSQHHQKAQINQ
jgi:hypothetical protein